MKFLKTALAMAAMTGFVSTAAAQDTGAYINLGVDAVEFDAYTISGKLGYKFTENFGIEGQAGFGIIDDDTLGVDVGVDSTFGGFLIASFPASENFDLFVRGGYHFTQIGAGNFSVDTDGFAVGGGGQYFFTENDGVRLEYTYFDVDTNTNAGSFGGDIFSLSYVRNF